MWKLIGIFLAAWATTEAVQAHFPYEWSHHLSEACEWAPRGSLGPLGRPEREHRLARAACKGAASPTPDIKVFVTHFPTPAELAAWRHQ